MYTNAQLYLTFLHRHIYGTIPLCNSSNQHTEIQKCWQFQTIITSTLGSHATIIKSLTLSDIMSSEQLCCTLKRKSVLIAKWALPERPTTNKISSTEEPVGLKFTLTLSAVHISTTNITAVQQSLWVTYCSMPSAFISVCTQPLQSPFHFKLHILSSEGVPCHREVAHGFRPHLHNHRVAGWEKVAQVVGKAANPGSIASLDSDQTHCKTVGMLLYSCTEFAFTWYIKVNRIYF